MKNAKVNMILSGLRAKTMGFVDMICWLYEYGTEGWDCDLLQIRLVDYVNFYQNNDEEDMKMTITNTETICTNGLNGIDIYEEENFIGASLSENENDLLLKVKDNNGKVQAFVIAVS